LDKIKKKRKIFISCTRYFGIIGGAVVVVVVVVSVLSVELVVVVVTFT
jgi:hypothetical protein